MQSISRRTFVETLASPTLAPALASKRVNLACIGCGAHGAYLMRRIYESRQTISIHAVCDIYPPNLASAGDLVQAKEGRRPKSHHDYQEALVDRDVDAVFVAVPEHLHHPMLLAALEAGKHVYLDGCLGQTLEQSVRAIHVWQRSGLAVQIGLQNRSHFLYRRAKELIEAGMIGRVCEVRAFSHQVSPDRDPDWAGNPLTNIPSENWQRFLGALPHREWEGRHLFRWRNYWDYSAGISADLICHQMDTANFLCGRLAPVSCRASGALYAWENSDREVPDNLSVLYEYGDRFEVSLIVQLNASDPDSAEEFLGEDGSIEISKGRTLSVYRRKRSTNGFANPRTLELQLEMADAPINAVDTHVGNFLEAVRGREEALATPLAAHGCMVATHLAAFSYHANQRIVWNHGRPRLDIR